MSKPTSLPSSVNSKGGKVGSVPTMSTFSWLAAPLLSAESLPQPVKRDTAATEAASMERYFLFMLNTPYKVKLRKFA